MQPTCYSYKDLTALVTAHKNYADGLIMSAGVAVGTVIYDMGTWSICLYCGGWMSQRHRELEPALAEAHSWLTF